MTHAREKLGLGGVGSLGVQRASIQQTLLVVHKDKENTKGHAHVGAGHYVHKELQNGAHSQRRHVLNAIGKHPAARTRALAQVAHNRENKSTDGVAVGEHKHKDHEERATLVGTIGRNMKYPTCPKRGNKYHYQQHHGYRENSEPAAVGHYARRKTHATVAEEKIRDVPCCQVKHKVEQVVAPKASSRTNVYAQDIG